MAFEKGKGVIEGGENKIKFYAKEVEATSEAVQFTDADLIGELTDFSGMGSQRDSKELTGYHYDKKLKSLGNSNDNDVSFTENLTKAELAVINQRYAEKTICAYGAFESGELLYGFCGQISQKGMTLPNGETCTLTYTVAGEEKTDYTVTEAEA